MKSAGQLDCNQKGGLNRPGAVQAPVSSPFNSTDHACDLKMSLPDAQPIKAVTQQKSRSSSAQTVFPFRNVDVVANGFVGTVAAQLALGNHLAQIVRGSSLGDDGHLHVLPSIQSHRSSATHGIVDKNYNGTEVNGALLLSLLKLLAAHLSTIRTSGCFMLSCSSSRGRNISAVCGVRQWVFMGGEICKKASAGNISSCKYCTTHRPENSFRSNTCELFRPDQLSALAKNCRPTTSLTSPK